MDELQQLSSPNSSDSDQIWTRFPIDILRVIFNYLRLPEIVKLDTTLVNHAARAVYLQAIKGKDFPKYFSNKVKLTFDEIHWLASRQVSLPSLSLLSPSELKPDVDSLEPDCAAIILQNSQTLKSISIPECSFKDIFFTSVQQCRSLISINLINGNFTDDQFIILVRSMSNIPIESLDISNCHLLTSKSIDLLCESCSHLQDMGLGQLHFINDEIMNQICHCFPKLRSLNLSGTLIGDKSVHAILEVYPYLESLHVQSCQHVSRDLRTTSATTIINRQMARLRSDELQISIEAIRSLGNFASVDNAYRDLIISSGALEALISLEQPSHAIVREVAHTLCKLFEVKPFPFVSNVAGCFSFLLAHLKDPDDEVVTDICLTLSYISDGPNDRIQLVLNAGFLPPIVEILASTANSKLQFAANRFVGNVLTGDEQQTQAVINLGIIPLLSKLLDDEDRIVVKETCWSLSNIAAGSISQVQALIDGDIYPKIIKLGYRASPKVRSECFWCIANPTTNEYAPHADYFVQHGVLEFCAWGIEKRQSDPKDLSLLVETIRNIVRTDRSYDDRVITSTSLQLHSLKLSNNLSKRNIDELLKDIQSAIPNIFQSVSSATEVKSEV